MWRIPGGAGLILFGILATAPPALGQQRTERSVEGAGDAYQIVPSWTASIENDTFMPEGRGSDQRYTNGLHFFFDTPSNRGSWWARLCRNELICGRHNDPEGIYVVRRRIAQTHHTPDTIERGAVAPGERPYAGLIFGEVELINLHRWGHTRDSPWQIGRVTSFGLLAGVWGHHAHSETAQAGFHTIQGHRDPKGWESSEEFGLAFQASYRSRVSFRFLDILSFEPELEARLGDPKTEVGGSLNLRVGTRLRAFAPTGIGAELVPRDRGSSFWDRFRLEGLASWRARRVISNGFLERGLVDVPIDPVVHDFTWAVRIEAWRWAATYLQTKRTPELADPAYRVDHDFGALQLTRFLDGTPTDPVSWLFRRFEISASLGNGYVDLRGVSDPGGDRHSMRVLVNYRLTNWLSLNVLDFSASGLFNEDVGVGIPYTDHFLKSTAHLRGVHLRPTVLFGGPQWLAGLQLSAAQASGTRVDGACYADEPGDICGKEESDLGTALQLGAYLGLPLGGGVRFGPDFTWRSFGDEGSLSTATLRLSWEHR